MKSGRAVEEGELFDARRITRRRMMRAGMRNGRREFMGSMYGLALTKDFLGDPDLYQLTSNIGSLPL